MIAGFSLKTLIRVGLLTSSSFLLSACLWQTPTVNTESLEGLQNLTSSQVVKTPNINQIRLEALKQSAMSIGAQGGLAMRSKQIDGMLKKDQRWLDQAFNFNPMILHHNVLPPVLEEGRNTLNQPSPDVIRVSDKTYKIVEQAHFITTPPTWREYLWLDYKEPPPPDPSLLPKNDEEREIWKKDVAVGWQQGIRQANNIFNAGLAHLKRDYHGMVIYRQLLAQNMVSYPFVSTSHLGVTGNGTDMSINDQILRIASLPQLQTNTNKWKPAIVGAFKAQDGAVMTPVFNDDTKLGDTEQQQGTLTK